jgi:hypothetical protein
METSFNIVELIENNPITKLSGSYQNKFLAKIKENFSDTEQQMFVASFYCYLKYDKKNDFVIDLDDVWKWLGFSQKVKAKTLLENNFMIDIDYKLLLSRAVKQTIHGKGGHNKEIIMLTIRTFKLFCLKAGTKKAEQIHEYYIKLEETLQELIEEECNELKLQLEQNSLEIIKVREKTLLEQFPKNVQCVYYGTIDNVSGDGDENERLIKFGNSNHLKNRVVKHKETYSNFRLMNAFKVENKLQIENALKENPVFIERQRTLHLKGKKYVELFNTDGLTFVQIDKIIKDIIMRIEYSPENYYKMVEENNKLRKLLDEKNENKNAHQLVLLETENRRLKCENIKLFKKYNSIVNKNVNLNLNQGEDEDVLVDDEEIAHYEKMININTFDKVYRKNKDGKYNINGKIYDKLFGTRAEVWDEIAYKTTGCLLKRDFIVNKSGKIVSKKKCIHETIHNKFEQYGVNKVKDDSNNAV